MGQKQSKEFTLDWWIKWVSSIFLIIGMVLTSNNIFPANLFISTIGIAGWIIVGMLWRDRSIMILNAIAFSIYFNGIVKYLWGE